MQSREQDQVEILLGIVVQGEATLTTAGALVFIFTKMRGQNSNDYSSIAYQVSLKLYRLYLWR
ncbi:hypothetical protein [Bartonella sp. CB178]|uniref:hypothetical protein n=1 Tax=Bartonella sp. CB178 TaxID=3112255 RepID=UPI00300E51A5